MGIIEIYAFHFYDTPENFFILANINGWVGCFHAENQSVALTLEDVLGSEE